MFNDSALKKNWPLRDLTTMKTGGPALYLMEINKESDIPSVLIWAEEKKIPLLIIGGGSNMVVSDSGFPGLVLLINIKGYQVALEDKKRVYLKLGAGMEWDEAVKRMVKRGLWGAENMSGIPGKVGAFVVQNAGAYGQECAQILEQVVVFDIRENVFKELTKSECLLRYRASVFNSEERGRYIITRVYLRLEKEGRANINYPDTRKYFELRSSREPDVSAMRRAIIDIRANKLPDWKKIPSAGSFFKNLILKEEEFRLLKKNVSGRFGADVLLKLEEIKNKFSRETEIKIPAAFLLDICGLKGLRMGNVRIYEQQPLVIINEQGRAGSREVMTLFAKARREVYQKTGMILTPEPELAGFSQKELDEYFSLD